jgi:hypothetical protein
MDGRVVECPRCVELQRRIDVLEQLGGSNKDVEAAFF